MRQLRDFEGRWTITREVTHADGTRFHFTGEARFAPEGDGLIQHEAGEMRGPDGSSFHGERRYLWGPGLDVRFDDGRAFHTVPPEGGAASHWCDPDQYDVTYDFADWPRWRAVWRVRGPRKDYTMVTVFAPAAQTGLP